VRGLHLQRSTPLPENIVMRVIRLFMLYEAATFIAASLIHSGVLIAGYEHHRGPHR
jgi:hypothetical protein